MGNEIIKVSVVVSAGLGADGIEYRTSVEPDCGKYVAYQHAIREPGGEWKPAGGSGWHDPTPRDQQLLAEEARAKLQAAAAAGATQAQSQTGRG